MFKKACIMVALALVATGCQTASLNLDASKVRLSPNPPAKNCSYKGAVTGQADTFFGSGKNLEQDAMNNMRNQAANMGANYVQLTANPTGALDSQQTKVTDTGNAYHCPYLD